MPVIYRLELRIQIFLFVSIENLFIFFLLLKTFTYTDFTGATEKFRILYPRDGFTTKFRSCLVNFFLEEDGLCMRVESE